MPDNLSDTTNRLEKLKLEKLNLDKLNLEDKYAKIITMFLRNNSNLTRLRKVYNHLNTELGTEKLQELSNCLESISQNINGDGCGLLRGAFSDMVVGDFFKKNVKNYSANHSGESDLTVCDVDLSQKTINGKSTIGLDWSKNPKKSKREYFQTDLMIINLKKGQWWKKGPKVKDPSLDYSENVERGIYLVDHKFCKNKIKLSSNNKTNSLVSQTETYKMILSAKRTKLFIPLPDANKKMSFDILGIFK